MSQCQMIEERLTDTLLDQEPEESVPHVLGNIAELRDTTNQTSCCPGTEPNILWI